MKFDKWTVGLAAAGVVSLGAVAVADEKESPLNTLVSGTTLSGYVDTSGIIKPGGNSVMANRFINTAPSTYDGFNLNVAALRLEKPLDEGQWSAGYKVDLWFGPDAAALPGSLGGDNFAIKQAYVALRAPVGNGLDFKVGQFDTIIGYEVADSYSNPNFSRSLGFNLEPLSHTGVLVSYQVTDWLGLAGGVADSAFGYINQKQSYNGDGSGNGTLTYMGAVTLKAPESWGWLGGASLYAGIIDGGLNDSTGDAPNTMNYYAGVSVPTPIKQITVGASWDYLSNGQYLVNSNVNPAQNKGSYAQAIAGYVSWQVTEKMKLNGRVEYANAGYDQWVPVYNYDGEGNYVNPNDPEKIFSVTATLDYSLWTNVVSRLEVIWDHDLKGNEIFAGSNAAWLIVANVVYKF